MILLKYVYTSSNKVQKQSDIIFRMKWEVACILSYIVQLTAVHIILDSPPSLLHRMDLLLWWWHPDTVISVWWGHSSRQVPQSTPPNKWDTLNHLWGSYTPPRVYQVTTQYTLDTTHTFIAYFCTYSLVYRHRQVYGIGTLLYYVNVRCRSSFHGDATHALICKPAKIMFKQQVIKARWKSGSYRT